MQNLYGSWLNRLDEHESLLVRLEKDVQSNKKTLFTNQIDLLRDAVLKKEKTLHLVSQSQKKLNQLRSESACFLGLSVGAPIKNLFASFEEPLQKTLQERRIRLSRISNTVKRINNFNKRRTSFFTN